MTERQVVTAFVIINVAFAAFMLIKMWAQSTKPAGYVTADGALLCRSPAFFEAEKGSWDEAALRQTTCWQAPAGIQADRMGASGDKIWKVRLRQPGRDDVSYWADRDAFRLPDGSPIPPEFGRGPVA